MTMALMNWALPVTRLCLLAHVFVVTHAGSAPDANQTLWNLSAIDIDGRNTSLAPYEGNVALVVNVATY